MAARAPLREREAMSYDFYLNGPLHPVVCPTCHRPTDEMAPEYVSLDDANVTRNVSPIADLCLKAAGATEGKVSADGRQFAKDYSWWRIDGWRAGEIKPVLERALAEVEKPEHDALFRSVEADAKGWGTRQCVVRVLRSLLSECEAHPDWTFQVSG